MLQGVLDPALQQEDGDEKHLVVQLLNFTEKRLNHIQGLKVLRNFVVGLSERVLKVKPEEGPLLGLSPGDVLLTQLDDCVSTSRDFRHVVNEGRHWTVQLGTVRYKVQPTDLSSLSLRNGCKEWSEGLEKVLDGWCISAVKLVCSVGTQNTLSSCTKHSI